MCFGSTLIGLKLLNSGPGTRPAGPELALYSPGVRACVHACVHPSMGACVRLCVRASFGSKLGGTLESPMGYCLVTKVGSLGVICCQFVPRNTLGVLLGYFLCALRDNLDCSPDNLK